MDEKKTNEVEETKVTAPEAAAPAENTAAQTAEQEVAAAPAEAAAEPETPADADAQDARTDEGDEAENNAAENETPEHAEKNAAYASKAEVIARVKEIVYAGGEAERAELDRLKQAYYRLHNQQTAAEREAFIAAGGNAEDFMPAPDTEEEEFKAQMSLVRELRAKAIEALEQEKEANLKRKLEIIERIKEMAASPDEADKAYDELKQLQAEWKEIKNVPAERATELWKNYQLYVEQYYDQLRLNHEFRAYDFKKNYELKTRLCEAAEKLAETEDAISAFHQLQKLHQEFREIGPVAKEQREEVWKRFKDASTVVNKRHQDHFEALKASEEANLVKKTELCEKVEALDFENLKTFAQWDEMTKTVIALQAEWKTIGFTPKKVNSQIFSRFRAACDGFFKLKTAYFKATREALNANLTAKNKLVEAAEALKESTDWAATTNKLVELQKEWKTLGPVSHKVSEQVWKRFNEACNYFFDRKNAANSGQRQEEETNLAAKQGVIEKLRQILAEPVENQLQAVRNLQAEWNAIGHVPFRKKDKLYNAYREVCDRLYTDLHVSAGRRHLDNFKRNVAEKEGNELTRERARLQKQLDEKKQEITNYETNLTFFSSKSKKGNSLVEEVEKKVVRLKEDLQMIADKLKAINEQIRNEENK